LLWVLSCFSSICLPFVFSNPVPISLGLHSIRIANLCNPPCPTVCKPRGGLSFMDTESKLIIEKLMQEALALKALLHKSGIVFDETEKPKEEHQGYEKLGNL